ncbi:PDZ domain-containing protein [Candidatus Uhrbacteria bacterium]|nr:PDZ domain-containing protein [Candidatus Uhrbacteria bacterium]
MVKTGKATAIALAVVIFASGMISGIGIRILANGVSPRTTDDFAAYDYVWGLIKREAYRIPDRREMIIGSINGLLQSVDRHSTYFPPEDMGERNEQLEGTITGIGIGFEKADSEPPTITSVMEESPAAASEIKVGDSISEIDGQKTAGLTSAEITDLLRGDADTAVRLAVVRNEETIVMDIVRKNIEKTNVTVDFYDDIAFLKIRDFYGQAESGMEEAVDRIEKKTGKGRDPGPPGQPRGPSQDGPGDSRGLDQRKPKIGH